MSKKKDPYAVDVVCDDTKDQEKKIAETYLRPTVQAAATIKGQYGDDDKVNVNALVSELSEQVSLVHGGDLRRAEAMLISQAHTLDALFAEMVSRSRMNMGHYMDPAEKYMRLALKAQSQCRTTLETLSEIKNPRPYIQNNKAQYQQVNNGNVSSGDSNGTNTRAHAHAGENLKQANELLEDKTDEQQWMDTGAPQTAGGNDTEMETVGTKHGSED